MESNIVHMMPKAPQRPAADARFGGGNGGDGMDLNDRMASIERAQIQTGMDLSYMRGKVEDMPTKEWVTTRLIWVVLAVGAIGALVEAAGRLIS